jgi:hypothetical protein
MDKHIPRIWCLLILAFASSACSPGSPTGGATAAPTATLTQFALPPEATPTLSPPPEAEANLPESAAGNPTPTGDGAGNSTVTPAVAASNAAPPAGGRSTTGPLCNDAVFIEDLTIPDGTILAPEEEFVKTWRFRNTGICRWTTAYAIGFAYGNPMGGRDTKLPESVGPGGEVEVSIHMTAPFANGWYGGWWRLRNEVGSYFGDFVYVSILVSDGKETSTPY